jgi:hypothetical protein
MCVDVGTHDVAVVVDAGDSNGDRGRHLYNGQRSGRLAHKPAAAVARVIEAADDRPRVVDAQRIGRPRAGHIDGHELACGRAQKPVDAATGVAEGSHHFSGIVDPGDFGALRAGVRDIDDRERKWRRRPSRMKRTRQHACKQGEHGHDRRQRSHPASRDGPR